MAHAEARRAETGAAEAERAENSTSMAASGRACSVYRSMGGIRDTDDAPCASPAEFAAVQPVKSTRGRTMSRGCRVVRAHGSGAGTTNLRHPVQQPADLEGEARQDIFAFQHLRLAHHPRRAVWPVHHRVARVGVYGPQKRHARLDEVAHALLDVAALAIVGGRVDLDREVEGGTRAISSCRMSGSFSGPK